MKEFKKDRSSNEFLNATEVYHLVKADLWKHWEVHCLEIVAFEVKIAEKEGDLELAIQLKQLEVEIFDVVNKKINEWYMHRMTQVSIGDYTWLYALLFIFLICGGLSMNKTKDIGKFKMFVKRDQEHDDFYVIVK